MRILQLIDSLAPGGAETVAIQYANNLEKSGLGSYLCSTRAEGLLKQKVNPKVGYLYLKRKHTLDVFAFRRLIQFCKKNKIDVIHAHSSSFFLAFLVKIRLKSIGFVWHDHYGDSENLDKRPLTYLRKASNYMNTIISVNSKLRDWAITKLNCNRVVFLSNAVSNEQPQQEAKINLEGVAGFRIVCLANLRVQKDHLTLVQAFEQIHKAYPMASLHLIGKNWDDAYYHQIVNAINKSESKSNIHYYGSQSATANLLNQANIGVLSSKSEGLPMALLEYGLAGLGVVCTAVGECEAVVRDKQYCVPAGDTKTLAERIIYLFDRPTELDSWQKLFRDRIKNEYSIDAIMPKLSEIYKNSLP